MDCYILSVSSTSPSAAILRIPFRTNFVLLYLKMWIKTSLVLLTLTFRLPKVVPQSPENFDIEAKACQHRHGITDEEFEKMMGQRALPKEEPIESRRCFAECILAAEKLMKDGKLDEDAVLKVLKEEAFNFVGATNVEEEIRKVISDCFIKSDTGNCTSGYNSWNCVTQRLADYAGETDERDKAVERKCKATYNVDESIFVNGKSGFDDYDINLKDESNENHRCYVQCLMEGFGYIKDGELDQELVMQEVLKYLAEKSEKVDNDKLKEAVRTCAEKTGQEQCDRTYQMAKCIFNGTE